MILEPKDMIISPKQPYFVMATSLYCKRVIMRYGISHFYCFQRDKNINSSIIAVPDGCIDIVFCCDEKAPYAEVCGSVLKPTLVFNEKNSYFFGVRFLPGNSFKFKNATMSDFIEQQIPFLEVIDDKELFEKITSSKDFNYQIQVFMNKYFKVYEEPQKKDFKKFMVTKIVKSAGQIRVQELADEMGYSVRYINKVFSRELGLPPKVFCKLMRYQYLLKYLNDIEKGMVDINLSQLAIELGYYDQSHMIKGFCEFTNTTPMKYIHSLQDVEYEKKLIIL